MNSSLEPQGHFHEENARTTYQIGKRYSGEFAYPFTGSFACDLRFFFKHI